MRATSEPVLHRMARLLLYLCSLLCAWAAQQTSPFASIPNLHEILCLNTAGLNVEQQNICIEVPAAMSILVRAEGIVSAECAWQFRREQWNCTGAESPIFNRPPLQEIKENAFIYALTSAVTVHQITWACSHGDLPSCGCDTSQNGVITEQGWKWGSCSDNVSYGVTYARRFLDARELNVTSSNRQELEKAMVHIHNNAAGRRVVEKNVKTSCRCHGLSGSCATKTCWRELPTLYEVGDILRTKYDNAVKVDVHHPRHGGPATLRYYDSDSDVHRKPPNTELVYLEKSGNYCILIQNYTQGRYCMPSTNLTTTSRLGQYYPPCEDFCCTRQFYAVQRQEVRSCNCRFVWCCEVVCQTCTETITEYRCTG